MTTPEIVSATTNNAIMKAVILSNLKYRITLVLMKPIVQSNYRHLAKIRIQYEEGLNIHSKKLCFTQIILAMPLSFIIL